MFVREHSLLIVEKLHGISPTILTFWKFGALWVSRIQWLRLFKNRIILRCNCLPSKLGISVNRDIEGNEIHLWINIEHDVILKLTSNRARSMINPDTFTTNRYLEYFLYYDLTWGLAVHWSRRGGVRLREDAGSDMSFRLMLHIFVQISKFLQV